MIAERNGAIRRSAWAICADHWAARRRPVLIEEMARAEVCRAPSPKGRAAFPKPILRDEAASGWQKIEGDRPRKFYRARIVGDRRPGAEPPVEGFWREAASAGCRSASPRAQLQILRDSELPAATTGHNLGRSARCALRGPAAGLVVAMGGRGSCRWPGLPRVPAARSHRPQLPEGRSTEN